METIAVVIPTYNERQNISLLVPELKRKNDDLLIIIVDGGSIDGTGDAVNSLRATYKGLFLISEGNKMGLAAALQKGFRFALDRTKADWIVSMDADFSHRPADLGKLVEAGTGVDMVVGSRFVEGGVVNGMPEWRRVISRMGNLYSRFLTVIPVRDTTSGFVSYRRELLYGLLRSLFKSNGYAFQMESKVSAYMNGARIREIPIVFEPRRSGDSKFSLKILFEGLRIPWLLRNKSRKFLKLSYEFNKSHFGEV